MEIKIHDVETGEIIEREMTANELSILEKIQADAALEKAEREAKETARLAVLDKLGLTAEDIAALGL